MTRIIEGDEMRRPHAMRVKAGHDLSEVEYHCERCGARCTIKERDHHFDHTTGQKYVELIATCPQSHAGPFSSHAWHSPLEYSYVPSKWRYDESGPPPGWKQTSAGDLIRVYPDITADEHNVRKADE